MKKLILVALGAMFMFGSFANAAEAMKKDDMSKESMVKKDSAKKHVVKKHEAKKEAAVKDDMGMKDEMKKGM